MTDMKLILSLVVFAYVGHCSPANFFEMLEELHVRQDVTQVIGSTGPAIVPQFTASLKALNSSQTPQPQQWEITYDAKTERYAQLDTGYNPRLAQSRIPWSLLWEVAQ